MCQISRPEANVIDGDGGFFCNPLELEPSAHPQFQLIIITHVPSVK